MRGCYVIPFPGCVSKLISLHKRPQMTVHVVLAVENKNNLFPKILVCEIFELFDPAFDRQHALMKEYSGSKSVVVLMTSKTVL